VKFDSDDWHIVLMIFHSQRHTLKQIDSCQSEQNLTNERKRKIR
jgi:hypothetical protein